MEIYSAAEDSYLLQKIVRKEAIGNVLDMGTGSGILAIEAVESPSVKSVLACDLNENAVNKLKEKIKERHLKKIKVLKSDLFSEVENIYLDVKFDTIIFNPPYLPQDYIGGALGEDAGEKSVLKKGKKIEDIALYGGEKGWEVIERFLSSVNEYLSDRGKILLLFSSHTNKEKVEEFIEKNLFEFEVLVEEKQEMFETLYVYKIERNKILKSLVANGIKNLKYLAKGKRGLVYKGRWNLGNRVKSHIVSDWKDVAIKMKKISSLAPGTLELEAKFLKEVNKVGVGPRLYFAIDDFLIMELVSGISFDKYLEQKKRVLNDTELKEILKEILWQCYKLDKLKISKDEMHRPYKNVIVCSGDIALKRKVVLLDFERCRKDLEPQNVSQFLTFLTKRKFIDLETGKNFAKEYKKNYSRAVVELIVNSFSR